MITQDNRMGSMNYLENGESPYIIIKYEEGSAKPTVSQMVTNIAVVSSLEG